jgi:hypothetical protein
MDDSTDGEILVTTGFEAKIIEECGLEISHVADDFVSVRFADDLFSGRLFIAADHADRLADQLREHAAKVRQAD